MTSTLKVTHLLEHRFEKTVEQQQVNQFIARMWWRWHTQHHSLGSPDMVTSCLFLVSLMHLAVGSEGSSVVPKSLPSTAHAKDFKVSKDAQPIARAI